MIHVHEMTITSIGMTAGASVVQPEAVTLIDKIIGVAEWYVAVLCTVLANIYSLNFCVRDLNSIVGCRVPDLQQMKWPGQALGWPSVLPKLSLNRLPWSVTRSGFPNDVSRFVSSDWRKRSKILAGHGQCNREVAYILGLYRRARDKGSSEKSDDSEHGRWEVHCSV